MAPPKKPDKKPPVTKAHPTPTGNEKIGDVIEKQKRKEITEGGEHSATNSSAENKKEWLQKIKQWQTADKIAVVAVLVNAGMLIITLVVVIYTKRSLDISNKALISTQQQFDIENLPYIFLSGIKIDTVRASNPIRIGMSVKNYGKTPALTLYTITGMHYSNSPDIKEYSYDPSNMRPLNMFMPTEEVLSIPAKTESVTINDYSNFIHNNLLIYTYGEVCYIDVIKRRSWLYAFCFQVLQDGKFLPTVGHNCIKEIGPDSAGYKRMAELAGKSLVTNK